MSEMKEVGRIAHYFTRISVAVIELTDKLSIGDRILISGSTTSFEQTIDSMQIEHEDVTTAGLGQSIGLKVKERVREGDRVYKIIS